MADFTLINQRFIVFLIISLLYFGISRAQGKEECTGNCFSTEIISIEPDGDCFHYEIEVIFSGSCVFELSHYDFDLGCGTMSNA